MLQIKERKVKMEIQFTPIVTQKQASELAKVAEKIYYDYYNEFVYFCRFSVFNWRYYKRM